MISTSTGQRLGGRLSAVITSTVIIAGDATPDANRRRFCGGIAGLLLVGSLLRVLVATSERCLWIDEAMLALNILDRSPAQLLEPLDWNQGAPVGFLLLVKLAVATWGAGEWVLRLVPLLSSLVALGMFTWLAGRWLPPRGAILAVGLFAVSPSLVSYAGECKQYQTDAAVALVLFGISSPWLEGTARRGHTIGLAVGGALALWFSHPAMFVLAGLGAAMLASAIAQRSRRDTRRILVMAGSWGLSLAVCYAVCLRHLGANAYLTDYWADHFLPLPPRTLGDVAWFVDHLFDFFRSPAGFDGATVSAAGLAAVLALVGWYRLFLTHHRLATAILFTFAATLLTSGLRKYPFGGRLLLFLVPLALWLVGSGLHRLVELLGTRGRSLAVLLVGMVIAGSLLETMNQFRTPKRAEELRPALHSIQDGWQPGDQLYIYYGARPAYEYYRRLMALPMDAITMGTEHRGEPHKYREELQAMPGTGRLWLLFAHRHEAEEPVIRAYLDGERRQLAAFRQQGAAAYLYE